MKRNTGYISRYHDMEKAASKSNSQTAGSAAETQGGYDVENAARHVGLALAAHGDAMKFDYSQENKNGHQCCEPNVAAENGAYNQCHIDYA